MPDDQTAVLYPTNLSADVALHQRLLAMPAANDAPAPAASRFPGFLAAWRERRFAAECCRKLMRLHSATVSSHPGSSRADLYRLIVSAHVGGDAHAADALLERAQESYALWPVPHALTFRDVAHYLAVSGYWAAHRGQRWICSDIRRVIDASVPRHL
jgi:hypothetical protein